MGKNIFMCIFAVEKFFQCIPELLKMTVTNWNLP
jgi:hypothetical protein